MTDTPTRRAWIASTDTAIAAYLPRNYAVVDTVRDPTDQTSTRWGTLIEGTDNAGWTLDGYVLPRLASGLYFGKEIS